MEELKDYIGKWGNAHSEALLESPHHIFQMPGIEGVIGYWVRSKCAITFGDPLCSPEEWVRLVDAFHAFCEKRGWTVIYIIASEEFAHWAIENHCRVLVEIGEEVTFDPRVDITVGHAQQKLRNYLHHAADMGLKFQEYKTYNEKVEKGLEEVSQEWLKGRKGPQIHLAEMDFFRERDHKRWFYTKQGDQIVAGALLSKLPEGWLLKFLITHPEVPRGTTELTMLSLLKVLRKEKCRFLTYGIVPTADLGEVVGLGKLSTSLARMGFRLTNSLFHLDRKKEFWKKFKPKTSRTYLLFSKRIGVRTIKALFKSLKIEL